MHMPGIHFITYTCIIIRIYTCMYHSRYQGLKREECVYVLFHPKTLLPKEMEEKREGGSRERERG